MQVWMRMSYKSKLGAESNSCTRKLSCIPTLCTGSFQGILFVLDFVTQTRFVPRSYILELFVNFVSSFAFLFFSSLQCFLLFLGKALICI